MGWASGSELMTDVMYGLKKKRVDEKTRKLLYRILIPAMQERDWDTEKECLELDPAYDAVLRELDPEAFEDFEDDGDCPDEDEE